MKKILFLSILLLAFSASAAESAAALLTRVASHLKGQKSIVAEYVLQADGQRQKGRLTVAGSRFTISSPAVSVWFDGKTQWTYNPQIGEVNITEPDLEELGQINPFAIIQAFQRDFTASYQGNKIKLVSRSRKGEIRTAVIGVNTKTLTPTDVTMTLANGQKVNITITQVKDGGALKPSSFTFNPKSLPRKAKVVDLR